MMVNEKQYEALKGITEDPDFQKMWKKMHTPWKRRFDKVRPNDICPFCGSGKKIKNVIVQQHKIINKQNIQLLYDSNSN